MSIVLGGLFVLGILCFVYYGIIINYAGISSSFSWFWLAAGLCFFALCFVLRYMKTHDIQFPQPLKLIVLTVAVIGVSVFTLVEGTLIYHASQKPDTKVDYLVVLGAQVRGTRITNSLKKRLESATTYLKENTTTVAIVSGGKGPGEDITEAEAMMNYLLKQGIEKERIIKEEKSTNTNENIRFSKQLINDENASVAIVTNGFHVFRAVSIAKKQKIGRVQGLAAPSDRILLLNYYVREGLAVLKDKIKGNF